MLQVEAAARGLPDLNNNKQATKATINWQQSFDSIQPQCKMVALNEMQRAKLLSKWNESPNTPFKFVSPNNDIVLCTYCEKTFNVKQNCDLRQHSTRNVHEANKRLKSKKRTALQATLEEVTAGGKLMSPAEVMHKELCEALLSADIPLFKMHNPELKKFLEKNIGKTMPSEANLRQKYVPMCYQEVTAKMREEIGQASIWVSSDCAKDSTGREVANVVVGKLDSDSFSPPFLAKVAFLETANGDNMARLINDTTRMLDPNFDGERLRVFVSDAAPYMLKCGRNLQVFFPKVLHVTCACHGLAL